MFIFEENTKKLLSNFAVTPCAGVWIEIQYKNGKEYMIKGHFLCGSVD